MGMLLQLAGQRAGFVIAAFLMGMLRLAAEVSFFGFLRFLGFFRFLSLCALLGMGMLLQLAGQRAGFVIAASLMGMLRLAAEVGFFGLFRFLRLPVGGAFLGMGVLLLAAGKLPGAIAAGAVDMVFLRIGAGQRLGIQRHRNHSKAGVGMLMGQNLGLSANQIARAIEAGRRVLMQRDFPSFTDQHRLGWLLFHLRLLTDQDLLPLVALVRVRMGRFLRLAASQLPGNLIAAFAVDMALGFLQTANQASRFVIAAIPVGMALAFGGHAHQGGSFTVTIFGMDMLGLRGLRADQRAPLQGIAILRMDMYRLNLREEIAGFPMGVGADLGQRAPKGAVFVPAGSIMVVNHEVGIAAHRITASIIAPSGMPVDSQSIRGAHRSQLLHLGHLGVAFIGMGMLRKNALTFHRDGREDQRIGDTEHHHCRQAGYHLMPASFYPIRPCIFLSIQLHIAVTILYDLNAPRSGITIVVMGKWRAGIPE